MKFKVGDRVIARAIRGMSLNSLNLPGTVSDAEPSTFGWIKVLLDSRPDLHPQYPPEALEYYNEDLIKSWMGVK